MLYNPDGEGAAGYENKEEFLPRRTRSFTEDEEFCIKTPWYSVYSVVIFF